VNLYVWSLVQLNTFFGITPHGKHYKNEKAAVNHHMAADSIFRSVRWATQYNRNQA
jgi:hypothetical protein